MSSPVPRIKSRCFPRRVSTSLPYSPEDDMPESRGFQPALPPAVPPPGRLPPKNPATFKVEAKGQTRFHSITPFPK